MRRPLTPAIALLLAAPFALAAADDVTDEFVIAQQRYAAGDMQGSLESVRLIEAWLLERLAEGLTGIFGDLEHWEKEVGEGNTAGAAFMGGGVSASCRYTKDELRIDANVLGNSPMLSMAMTMISNPMLTAGSGGSIVKINGEKAMIKKDGSRWELLMPFQNTVLVDIKTDATKDDAIACARAINWELLGELMTAQ